MSVVIKQPAMRDFFTRLFESIDQLAKNIGFLFTHFVLRGKVGMFDYDFEENEEDGLIHIRGNGIEPQPLHQVPHREPLDGRQEQVAPIGSS